MTTEFEDVLDGLESLSAEAVKITDPALGEVMDTVQVLELLMIRGTLVKRLEEALSGSAQLTYIDFNRLVIVQFQGTQMEANLKIARSELAVQLSANVQGQAYLARTIGVVEASRTLPQTESDLAACVL